MTWARAIVALTAALALSACARSTTSGELAAFSQGVGKVHAQADLAFARANAVSRQAAIDVFVASRRPGLSERAFPPALEHDDVVAWDAALDDLQRYGDLLATLLDGGRGRRTSGAAAALGRELADGAARARIDPGVGAGFAALAGILVDARAASSARGIMRAADPSVRRLLLAMADAIGRDRTQGVQGTVWSNWTAATGGVRDQYAPAAEKGDEARQRALVADYLAALDRRDADLRSLSSLRASLISLADAHAAAAAGSAPGQMAVLEAIDRRLVEARRDVDLLGGGGK